MATTLTEDITGVFTVGNFDDLGTRLLAIQKQIEKSLITNVYAPHILSKRDGIKTKSLRKRLVKLQRKESWLSRGLMIL